MLHMSHAKKTYIWTVSVVVAFILLGAGLPKIFNGQDWTSRFHLWELPDWFRVMVGWVEVIGAFLLVYKSTALYASGVLMMLMAGATYTQAIHGGTAVAIIFPAILGILLFTVFVLRWPHPLSETGALDEPIEEDTDDDESPVAAR